MSRWPNQPKATRAVQLLGDELDTARKQVNHVMRYMTAAVRAARATCEDGQPVSKQAIIRESGLARQTVYGMLGEVPTGEADRAGS